MRANRDLVYKKAPFYKIAVAVQTLSFSFAAIYHPRASDDGSIRGGMTRWLALMLLALYALYMFVQCHDTIDKPEEIGSTGIRAAVSFGGESFGPVEWVPSLPPAWVLKRPLDRLSRRLTILLQ